MSEHSVLPPSDSARRRQCPQSTTLQALYPETEEKPEAAEGVAAHWAVAEQLNGRLVDIGVVTPNNVVLDLDMVQAADLVSDYVEKLLAPHGLKPRDGRVEERVQIPRVHPLSWGTPDYWIHVPGKFLLLLDFKYGHKYVEAFENPQLVEYLAGISDTVAVSETTPVVAVIVQPRSFHRDGAIREWRTTLLALRSLINVASNAAHEALGPDPRAQVGLECYECRARHACPALQAAAYVAMDEAKHVVPLELPPAALSLELRLARRSAALLKERIGGLEEQAKAMIKRGASVPGWGIEHAGGREKWTRPVAEVQAIGEMLGVNVTKPPELITPAQARAAGLLDDVVAAVSERQRGGAALVEVTNDELRRVFG